MVVVMVAAGGGGGGSGVVVCGVETPVGGDEQNNTKTLTVCARVSSVPRSFLRSLSRERL